MRVSVYVKVSACLEENESVDSLLDLDQILWQRHLGKVL